MNNFIKIEGHPDLIRDKQSKGVINTNTVEYQKYMTVQLAKKSEKMKIENMCDEINNLKDEMKDIKRMLMQVLEK